MVGLVLVIIGYVIAIAWAVWRAIRVPSMTLPEHLIPLEPDTVTFPSVLMSGVAASPVTGPTHMLRRAGFLPMVIAMPFASLTPATDIKFMHPDK
ncbi:hypothetical protein [Bifidobacterium apri]|uniref:Uncharacterized protein n=1 Tax=Bifidobacterium apri TaxID=1769423 RepID=A0A6A2WBQ7_9BIFI|nr:hypothetical protein [Bifidobacterium apri]KAB8290643.1 hypothetical protein DSM100238_1856 [Bifidobacterium apri]